MLIVTRLQFFPVTSSDYILGLSDLSGELMRLTLNAIAKGRHEVALKTLSFVRELKSRVSSPVLFLWKPPLTTGPLEFDQLTGWVPYLDKKQEITDQSLRKIETGAPRFFLFLLCAVILKLSFYLQPHTRSRFAGESLQVKKTFWQR